MPDPMTKEKRAELRKLAEAATPGPWTATKDFKRYWIECAGQKICGGNAIGEITNDDTDADEAAANAGHVAAANPTVLLSLLDTLDAAEAEAGRLREVVADFPKDADGNTVSPFDDIYTPDGREGFVLWQVDTGMWVAPYENQSERFYTSKCRVDMDLRHLRSEMRKAYAERKAARAAQGTSPDESLTVEDGHGSKWGPCPTHGCKMQVMRPGDARCPRCEREWWTKWSAKESAQGTSDAGKGETK